MKKITLKSYSKLNRKRVGRGISAGQGKTGGRGTKGQNSRAGHNIPKRFEGGQTPLSMRLPKLAGFKHEKVNIQIISLDQISQNYKDGEKVTPESLIAKKLLKKGQKAKILNNGNLKVKVMIENVSVSNSVKSKFQSAEQKDEKKKTAKASANKDLKSVVKK